MTGIFISVQAAYLLGLIVLAWVSYSKTGTVKEFLVMGRSAGAFLAGAAYFATQFSMSSLVGVPGEVYSIGFAGLGIILSIAMLSMAFGVLVAGGRLQSLSRRLELLTLPDYLAARADSAGVRAILLSGHMDVVGPGDLSGWRFDPFSATAADGCLWGRGAVDMKGALAAELAAVSAVKRIASRLHVHVMLGATVDDETAGEMGQKYVLERGLESAGWPRPGLHILGEANGLNITGAFKGRIWLRVAVRGRTAHGGAPQEGVNAIDKLMEYVRRLQARPPARHPLVGADTLNVGTIRGGTRVNAVADECEAELDFRFGTVPAEEAERGLREVMERLGEEDPSFAVREFRVFERRDPVAVDPAAPDVGVIAGAIARITGREPAFLGTLSAGDAYHSLRRGIPAVWVGPGDARLMHAPNERIGLDELVLAARVYASILLAWAGVA